MEPVALLDYFAGQALTALITTAGRIEPSGDLAGEAYEIAHAMVEARREWADTELPRSEPSTPTAPRDETMITESISTMGESSELEKAILDLRRMLGVGRPEPRKRKRRQLQAGLPPTEVETTVIQMRDIKSSDSQES